MKFKIDTFEIEVDYDKTVDRVLRDWHVSPLYLSADRRNPFTEPGLCSRFCGWRKIGIKRLEIAIVRINADRGFNLEEAEEYLAELEGFRSANLNELIAFGNQFPNQYPNSHIVALGAADSLSDAPSITFDHGWHSVFRTFHLGMRSHGLAYCCSTDDCFALVRLSEER